MSTISTPWSDMSGGGVTLPEFEWSLYAPQVRHISITPWSSWCQAVDNHVVREPAAYIPASAAVTITHPYYPYSHLLIHAKPRVLVPSHCLDRWRKNLCGQGISLYTVSWIAWFLASTMSKNVPSGWAFGSPSCGFFARPTLTRGASAPQTLCIMLWQTVHIGLWCLGFSQYFSSTHQSACNARCPQGQVIRKNSWDRGLLILLTMVFFQSVRNIARLHSSREIQSHLIHVMYSMYSKHVWATFLVWEELPDIPWPSFNAQNAANTTCSGLFNGPEFALAADVARNDEAPGCDCDRFPCWATKLRDGSPEIQHISTSHLETSTWVLRVTSSSWGCLPNTSPCQVQSQKLAGVPFVLPHQVSFALILQVQEVQIFFNPSDV